MLLVHHILEQDEFYNQLSEQAEMADLTDADMMEADAPSHQQAHSGDGGVKELLAAARQLVDQGKPSEALQAVKPPLFPRLDSFSSSNGAIFMLR